MSLKQLYKVTAIYHGVVAHMSTVAAKNVDDAIQTVKIYRMKPDTRYGTIKAVALRGVVNHG
jgi:hypothetical protein